MPYAAKSSYQLAAPGAMEIGADRDTGRELVEEHATENDALQAMQKLVEAKRPARLRGPLM
jgi:hypothetical protein